MSSASLKRSHRCGVATASARWPRLWFRAAESLTHLTAFVRDEGSQWLGVEAAEAKAQAAIHAVGGQLQSFLPDVVLPRNTHASWNYFNNNNKKKGR